MQSDIITNTDQNFGALSFCQMVEQYPFLQKDRYEKYYPLIEKAMSITEPGHFLEFGSFGYDEQAAIAQVSNSLLSVHQTFSFSKTKDKYYEMHLKKEEGIFGVFSKKTSKSDLINLFYNEVQIVNTNVKNQIAMFKFIREDIDRIENDLNNVLAIFKQIVNSLVGRGVLTLEEAALHPILANRLTSLQNSVMVVSQLLNTAEMAILSLQREAELADNFISVIYPGLSSNHLIGVFNEQAKNMDAEIVQFFKSKK